MYSNRAIAFSLFIAVLAACLPQPAPTTSVQSAGTPAAALFTPVIAASPTALIDAATATATVAASLPAASARAPASPTAAGTQAAASGVDARLDEPFTLRVSQWANLLDGRGSRVFLTSVREDTRCPVTPVSKCDGIGRALVAISVESGSGLAQFDLSTNPGEFRAVSAFNGYVIRLEDVAPLPKQPEPKIALGDYQVTLRVSAGSLGVPQARFNEPFTLKLGQAIGFEGSTLRLMFAVVSQDSRCPARVLCVTRGTATVALVATHAGATDRYALEVGGKGIMTSFPVVRTVAVTLYASALTPYPQRGFAGSEIASSEYEVTLLADNPAQPLPSPTPRKP